MSITARYQDGTGYRTEHMHIFHTKTGRKRITLRIGDITIQLTNGQALAMVNEVADQLETR